MSELLRLQKVPTVNRSGCVQRKRKREEGGRAPRPGSFGDRRLNEAGRADHTQVTALWWYIMRREGLQEFYLIPPIQPSVPLVVNRLAKDNDPSQHDGADTLLWAFIQGSFHLYSTYTCLTPVCTV